MISTKSLRIHIEYVDLILALDSIKGLVYNVIINKLFVLLTHRCEAEVEWRDAALV